MNRDTAWLILNGKFADNPAIRQAIEQMRAEGHHLEERITREAGEAARHAAEAAREGIARVVALGGDGTINEVVNGLFQDSETPATALGILPMGTANDFARGCGIPPDDPGTALRTALEAPAAPIDVGRINDRMFLNVVSLGFGAEVTASTPLTMKQALGGVAYSIQALLSVANLAPAHVRLFTDDGPAEELTLYFAAIANGCQAGGGYQVAPNAVLDDGLLDLMIVRETPSAEFPALIAEWRDPDHPDNTRILYRKLARFRLESADTIHLTIDGDPITGRSFEVRVLPSRLRVVLPGCAPISACAANQASR